MKMLLKGLSLALLLVTPVGHAENEDTVVFSTAPTHSPEEVRRLYKPLVSFLSKVTDRQFVVEPADNFIEYSNNMRAGKYDMLFDGPHLVAWRMVHLGHTPVARLPGEIKIVVVAKKDSPVDTMQDLEVGRNKVCAFASPNMLTMAFLSYFPNPSRQPVLLRAQGFKQIEQCVLKGHGEVAVLRDRLWSKMDQTSLKLIAAPERGYPERTFSLSRKLDVKLRDRIAEAMLSEEGQQAMQPILKRFKKDRLEKVAASDYIGLDNLLGTVWGFHSVNQ